MSLTKPFVHLENAIDAIKQHNTGGIKGILSYLAIKKDDAKSVSEEIAEYRRLLDTIKREKIDCEVSLKLHQFGIYGSKRLALKSVAEVVKHAQKLKNFVWIDAEMCITIDDTIDIFKTLHKKYKNIGICLQAYHKRTEQNMHDLLRMPIAMRLVKGFYKEDEITNWGKVTQNYSKLMEYLLLHSPRPCIATHDPVLIAKAKKFIKKHRIKNAEFEFFNGVCNDRALKLKKEGFNVRIYVPYGHVVLFFIKGMATFDLLRFAERVLGFNKIK